MRRVSACTLLAGSLAWFAGCAPQPEAPAPEPTPPPEAVVAEPEPLVAVATLSPRAESEASGFVTFTETGSGVEIVAEIANVSPGLHGFHLHEIGDCSAPDFTSAGGHFNPTDAPHGGPTDAERHAGDFGNIEIGEDGTGRLELTSDMLTVAEGGRTVIGRAVILHEGEDDLVSQPTGAAGARLACGVVVPADEEPEIEADEPAEPGGTTGEPR